jgi:branched-chain amino acid transport system permease protein
MDNFFTLAQLLITGILLGGVYAVMASGLSLIFGVVRILQISHSVLIILGCYLSYSANKYVSLDPILSLLITMPIMFFIGIAVYRFVVAPLKDALPVAVLLAFFGLILALENTIALIWTSNYNAIHSAYQGKSFLFLGFDISLPKAIAFGVAYLVIFTLLLFLRNTETGRAIRAVSQDRDTAQILGVDVDKIFVIVFGISAALAAVGGSLMGIIYSFYPALHWKWLGVVFSVVVLGGLGQVGGAIIAALIIGIAETFAAYYIGSAWGPFIAFAILIITLVQRPQGILGIKGQRI